MSKGKFKAVYKSKSGRKHAYFSATRKGGVQFVDPKSGKRLFDLALSKRDAAALAKVSENPKRATAVAISSGKAVLKGNLSWVGKVTSEPLAILKVDGAIASVVPAQDSDEPKPGTEMDPGTAAVVIVAILVVGWLGSKAIEEGATVDIDVDIPNAQVKVSVDGNGPPQLPDGGGDSGGDDGGDSGDDGGGDGGSTEPTPNPGDNSPPSD